MLITKLCKKGKKNYFHNCNLDCNQIIKGIVFLDPTNSYCKQHLDCVTSSTFDQLFIISLH